METRGAKQVFGGCAGWIGLIWALSVLLGCAHLAGREVDEEALLMERAHAYWQHKIKKEFAEAFLMESPEVRKGVRLTDYVLASAGGTIWMNVSVEEVSIREDQAEVRIKLTYAMFGVYTPKEGLTRVIKDCWQRVEGEWYHLPICPKKSPGRSRR